MQVREIMTANPACCTTDSTLQDVAKMMEQNDCGLIPVVDGLATMMPVGTITDRDITIRTVAASRNPINMKASDVMTPDIATVRPEMSIEECFDVMEDREIRRVLVVDERGKCCGIVAQADVVQADVNPTRTNRVIREISESAPSYNQSSAGLTGRSYQSNLGSFLSSGSSLMPLLIGMGSGMALMYLLSRRSEPTYRGYAGDVDMHAFDRVNATNTQNFGKYVDADEEVQKRQHHLEDRIQTLRADPDSPVNEAADAKDQPARASVNDKGRSAGQSS